jgi:AcrR family transcriptional regulator
MELTQPRPRKPRIREAAAVRRARIIEEAIGLVGERGYYGFTIQELGKRCGLSNPGLLHHFPSKLDVLMQVLAELEARESEFMTPLVQQAMLEARSKASVVTVLRALVERATDCPQLVRVLVELQAESLDPAHPAHAWWLRREHVTLDFLRGLLEPHVTDPANVARQLMAMMDGLLMQWLRAVPRFDAAEYWESALARLLPELADSPHGKECA